MRGRIMPTIDVRGALYHFPMVARPGATNQGLGSQLLTACSAPIEAPRECSTMDGAMYVHTDIAGKL